MRYVMKPLNKQEYLPLSARSKSTALAEAEGVIKDTDTKDIINVWEADTRAHRIIATWVPGRPGWTEM